MFQAWNQPFSFGHLPSTLLTCIYFTFFYHLYFPPSTSAKTPWVALSPRGALGFAGHLFWAGRVCSARVCACVAPSQDVHSQKLFLHFNSLRWILVCSKWRKARVELIKESKKKTSPNIKLGRRLAFSKVRLQNSLSVNNLKSSTEATQPGEGQFLRTWLNLASLGFGGILQRFIKWNWFF